MADRSSRHRRDPQRRSPIETSPAGGPKISIASQRWPPGQLRVAEEPGRRGVCTGPLTVRHRCNSPGRVSLTQVTTRIFDHNCLSAVGCSGWTSVERWRAALMRSRARGGSGQPFIGRGGGLIRNTLHHDHWTPRTAGDHADPGRRGRAGNDDHGTADRPGIHHLNTCPTTCPLISTIVTCCNSITDVTRGRQVRELRHDSRSVDRGR
jgi:hypothetical protein